MLYLKYDSIKKEVGNVYPTVLIMKKNLLITTMLLVLSTALIFSSCTPKNTSDHSDKSSQTNGYIITDDSLINGETQPSDPPSSDTDNAQTTEPPKDTGSEGKDTQKPADTQKPSDTQSPSENLSYEGTLRSNTSTSLNLVLSYKLTQNGNKTVIKYELGLDTYAIYVSARSKINHISFNGKKTEFSTDALDYDGKSKTYIKLFDGTEEIDGTGDIEVSAKWVFNGNYAGNDIDSIVINGTIKR